MVFQRLIVTHYSGVYTYLSVIDFSVVKKFYPYFSVEAFSGEVLNPYMRLFSCQCLIISVIMSHMHNFTFSSSLFCLVLFSTTLINEVHMAYSEIMKILLQVTAVKAVGKLLLAAFMAVVCAAIQGDSCADFASLHLQHWVLFLLLLVTHVNCFNMSDVLKGLSSA